METRKHYEKQITEKAIKDEDFRSELIANPKTTIENEFGVKLPDSVTIRVVEEKTDTFYLVLPCNPGAGKTDELSEKELAEVSAGVGPWYEALSYIVFCP